MNLKYLVYFFPFILTDEMKLLLMATLYPLTSALPALLPCTTIDVPQSCMLASHCTFSYADTTCITTPTPSIRGGSTDTTVLNSFVTLGDWGGAGLEDYHKTDELAVAKTLAASAASLNAQFLLNVGDNFYYYGVDSVTDPQWKTTFEDVYTAPSLAIPWYSVLGNHDYGFNPDAQLQYKSPVNDRWVMPSRYYTKRVEIGTTGQYISFIFLDASPCQATYRSEDKSGWDPCGGDYPGPSNCSFHKNVLAQDCGVQLTWLKTQVCKKRYVKSDAGATYLNVFKCICNYRSSYLYWCIPLFVVFCVTILFK